MDDEIEWVIIDRFGKNIGAIGFIGNDVAVIAAFYEDADADQDGKVGWGEWAVSLISPIKVKGLAVAEVAAQARLKEEVYSRDPSFNQTASQVLLNFAGNMIKDGIYASYFKVSIGKAAGAAAAQITSSTIKQFVIKKGMKAAVKKAYDGAVK